MKVRQFKNGSIKLTAESKADSEVMYMFLSGGKHSFKWFKDRIGKKLIMIAAIGALNDSRIVTITDEKHAHDLFEHWQDQHYKFSDIPTTS